MAASAKEGIRTMTLGSDGALREVTADRVYAWPCKEESCVDCEDQFLSPYDQCRECMLYTRRVADSEASAIANRLASSAQANRALIKQRLAQHGDLFMSRWKKRSKDKRTEILLRANADLPEKAGLFSELTQANGGDYNWRHNWAAFDSYQFRDPWKVGLFALEFLPLCVVVHGERYGQTVPFRSDAAHRCDILGFPRAQLLLEAQSQLMAILLRVMDITLEGANLDDHASTKWATMCDEGFRLAGDVVQWSTYTNQPFSSPPLLNLDDVISTAQLRFDALADHFALLQTDPPYLRRYIRAQMQGEAFKSGPLSDVFGMVDSTIASDALSMWWWLCVRDEAEHVRDVQRRFRDQIHRGAPLPPKYERALAALELVLVNQMNIRGYMLQTEIRQRPGFARHSRFEAMPDQMLRVSRTDTGPLANRFADDFMYWCLLNLCGKPDDPAGFDHAHLFASLEDHLAKSSRAENARLDQIIVDQLSGLAANHQLLLAVRLHRPLNGPGDAYEIKAEPMHTPSEAGKVTVVSLSSKAKTKTRPDASKKSDQGSEPPEKADSALAVAPQQATAPAQSAPTVAATKRAVEVFSKMFADDAESGSKGSDWDQFVHAMKDVGFTARNSAGSAVVFDLADKGKIVFHRPHPVAKIDPILLRAMGKRMAKWFGWCRESFVLDEA
ncbi:hypothetical protein LTR85_001277 [Meristemomyces frigidus]|nr:hypothetical protein LTR85_001277 [Meristemomyces frigidus]